VITSCDVRRDVQSRITAAAWPEKVSNWLMGVLVLYRRATRSLHCGWRHLCCASRAQLFIRCHASSETVNVHDVRRILVITGNNVASSKLYDLVLGLAQYNQSIGIATPCNATCLSHEIMSTQPYLSFVKTYYTSEANTTSTTSTSRRAPRAIQLHQITVTLCQKCFLKSVA
jgi:hypothetical protein